MTNDVAFLRAMASTLRRMAVARGAHNRELGRDLQALAVFTDSAALTVEDDDNFRSEDATSPGHKQAGEMQ